ncbi:MAG: PIN domain-containing protein [Holophagales bacterium]|nr:PIN domain-containing protein [Holophagales bacterium]
MEALIHLDTHVVAWLYGGELGRLSNAARDALDRHDLRISPMVDLELQYLFEIERITESPSVVLGHLETDIGLKVCDAPFPSVVRLAREQTWTRDPFDRLIVAQASLRQSPLLTRDSNIQQHYPRAVW